MTARRLNIYPRALARAAVLAIAKPRNRQSVSVCLNNRRVGFCPADKVPRSRFLAQDMQRYNGTISSTADELPAGSEPGIARRDRQYAKLFA